MPQVYLAQYLRSLGNALDVMRPRVGQIGVRGVWWGVPQAAGLLAKFIGGEIGARRGRLLMCKPQASATTRLGPAVTSSSVRLVPAPITGVIGEVAGIRLTLMYLYTSLCAVRACRATGAHAWSVKR